MKCLKPPYPHMWHTATIIPILKPNKLPHKLDSYRPISLLSCQSKILEKMIVDRCGLSADATFFPTTKLPLNDYRTPPIRFCTSNISCRTPFLQKLMLPFWQLILKGHSIELDWMRYCINLTVRVSVPGFTTLLKLS